MEQAIGLYLHIPFCDGKCYYCNFFSRNYGEDKITEYVSRMKESLCQWARRVDRPVRTVYFGGGTPSVIGHERLIDLLNTVKASFSVLPDAEITVEVNPSSGRMIDFCAIRGAGFNRLSIGMQSADDHELKLLGRRHQTEDVTRTVNAARSGGFDNISLDVMLAIPEQTQESLERTLRYCSSMDVQHISAYILKVEEGTRFYQERERLRLFDDDEQARFYEYAVRRLGDLGYPQYEISNFSRPGYESRHNLVYWHDEEYLGIGPSAHSYIDGRRFYYPDSFDAFYTDHTAYESDGGSKSEYIMLALRLTKGLVFERYEERYHEPLRDKFLSAARRLSDEGLVKLTDSSLSLTVRGFLVSNAVIGYLLETT